MPVTIQYKIILKHTPDNLITTSHFKMMYIK